LRLCADEGVSRAQRYVADGEVAALYVEEDATMVCVSAGASVLRIGKNLQTLWNRPLGGKPALVSRRQDGVILVATERGRVEGYNILGERVMDFPLPWKTAWQDEKNPASLLAMGETAEGWIYLCSGEGDFAVFSLKGFSLARWKTPQAPACPPLVFQGKIVFALEDGSVVSYSPSGRPAWKLPAASPVSLLAANPFARRLALGRKDGSFEVYAPLETEESGSQAGPGLVAKAAFESAYILPLASGGFVLVGNDGRVRTLSAEGLPGEDFFLKEGRPSGASTDGEGRLFFTETRGRLSSYSLAGSPLWTTELTGKPGPPVLSPSSRYLAVGCEDWVVQRFEFVGYGRAAARPEAPAPPVDPLRISAAPSLYRGEYDFIYFMDRASSPDAGKKKESLDICAGRIGKGDFGRSLDYISEILRYQAAEPHILRSAKGHADIQGRALGLLGRIGGSENAPFLSAFLMREKDEYLLRAALAAMGSLRSDPGGLMRREIQNFVSRGVLGGRLVSAVLGALEELSLYSGSLGPYGRAALLRLFENSSTQERQRIQSLLAGRP
jgi:outer membrane protein assembly factor BamB